MHKHDKYSKCNKCGKQPESEKQGQHYVMKLNCECGGRIETDFLAALNEK